MAYTPRHARLRKRPARPPQHARPATATLERMSWEPQPLSLTLGEQARRELAALAAARDAWSGSRDTDRRA